MLREVKTDRLYFFVDELNQKQCKFTEWYPSGAIDMICHYVNNILHGEFTLWHKNGKISSQGFYHNGNLHSEYKACDMFDDLEEHCIFVNGHKHTLEEIMLFKSKYRVPLLSDTTLSTAIIAAN